MAATPPVSPDLPVEREERADPGEPGSAQPVIAGTASGAARPGPVGWAWIGSQLRELPDAGAVAEASRDPDAVIWIDVGHDDESALSALADALRLHPLIVEDIVEQNQRAKVELTDSLLHLVMFALELEDGSLRSTEIDFVLGERFLLTAHAPTWDPLAVHRLRGGLEGYLRGGPDYVLWAITDALVDGYFPVFDRLGDELDELEDQVIRGRSRDLVERLFDVKRQLMAIRHAINPQREIFNQLTNRELGLVRPERIVYFRDVYDHLIRLTDELDTYRDMVGTALDAYLTTVNNDLSEVMKRLTAVTVILAGVGAIGGLFGMSEAGPALAGGELAGFWVVILAALALAAVAIAFFRRIDWL